MGAGTPNLPRELAPGVFWIGDCNRVLVGTTWTHSYQAPYLITGDRCSLLVDTGGPKDWRAIDRQLDELLARGLPPVTHLFPTHPEVAHAGNLGRLLAKFPDAVVGSVIDDLHLVFPQYADRLVGTQVGDEIDLGARTVRVIEAYFRDIPSQWLFDPVGRVLFTGDGFAYRHHHDVGECGKAAEEIKDLLLPELTAIFSDAAFYWTRFCDIEPTVTQLEELFATYEIDIVAPGHGSPIIDPPTTLPRVIDGLRLGQRITRATIEQRLAEHFTAVYES